jgi:hypothetical protein
MTQEIVKYLFNIVLVRLGRFWQVGGEFFCASVIPQSVPDRAGVRQASPVLVGAEGEGVRGPKGTPEIVIGPSYREFILFNSQPYILPLLKNGFKGFHPIALASSGAAHSGYPYSARGVTTTGDMAYTGRGKS